MKSSTREPRDSRRFQAKGDRSINKRKIGKFPPDSQRSKCLALMCLRLIRAIVSLLTDDRSQAAGVKCVAARKRGAKVLIDGR
jgi:hypothetical protein